VSVKHQIFAQIIDNDVGHVYQSAINELSKKHISLNCFVNSKVVSKCDDEHVLNAVELIANVCNEIDECEQLTKTATEKKDEPEPEMDFYTKAVLKTLKVAQTMLIGLMPKSPWKIAIAYNALHFTIKYVEKEMRAKALEKQKQKAKA
jgi:hypothetical protein